MRVIGYAFNGAAYCVECATNPRECECAPEALDGNGLCAANCHGYGPNPVFSTDEFNGTCDVCLEEVTA